MANSNDLELSLKIQSDFKAAKADIKQLEEALQATSDQSAARVAKEIADSERAYTEQADVFRRYTKQNKTKEEQEEDAAEATAKHEKEVQKLAAGLNKLLEAIDPALKGMSNLDAMEEKLAASFKAGVLDEQTYAENIKKILAQREALDKLSSGVTGFKSVDQSAKQAGRTIDETSNKTNVLAEQFNRLKNTAIAITGISFGANFIRGLAQTSDEYSNLNARIKLVSASNEQARLTFQSVIRLSNESSQSIASTAELYTRLARAMKDSASQSELLQVTSTINKAAVVSGATTQEASGAIIQLSQALASGVLRGQEFNSVAEQMPRIMEMLQKSLGKTQGELRKMAEQGLLTSSVVFKALKDGASEIDAEFAQMPLTISRATAQLANGWVEFVGGTNDALGVTKLFASVISGLAGNLSTLATAAVAVSVVIAGRKVAALLSAAQAARVERLETVLLAEAEMAQSKAAVAAAQAELARVNASRKSNIPQRVQAEQALTAALNQQAIAEKNLAAAKLGAPNIQQGLLGRMGSGLMGVLGGPMGIAITGVTLAVGGLTSAYAAAQEQEHALEQQHRQTIQTLDDQTRKTYALIDAQGKLRQGVSTGDALSQQKSNANALSEDVKSLQKLQGEAANLKAQIDTLMTLPTDSAGIALPPLLEKWKAVNQQIEELQPKYEQLNDAQVKLSDELDNRQLRILDSLNEKGITYREVLDNMFAQGPMPGTNYMTELDKLSLDTEQSLVKLSAEMDALQPKLEKDLANATYTAAQQLELLRDKIIQAASAAGRTEEIDGLRERFEKLIDLQHKIDKANEDKRSAASATRQAESAAKATESYVKGLEKQAATMGKTQAQVRAYELAERGLKGALLQRAQAALAVIAAEERKQVTDANAAKNAQLQAQFMQASGDELGATLLTLRTSTNALRKEFTQTGNTEGLAWLDKLLPAQEAKARADALKAEIDRIQQLRNQQESRIQTQVDVGLISELNGRRQLVELHQQVGQQLQQHLPLMHEMAQLPGETGRQMQAMLAELENELLVLQSTTDELVSAFKDGFQDGVENTLNGLANGTLALSDAVLNLGKSVVSAMAQVASRNLASMAMEGLGGLFSSGADTAAKTASDTAGAGMYATSITTASTAGATMYATAFTAGATALTTALTSSFAAGATALATAIGTASAAGGASSAFSAGLKGLGMGFAEGGHVTGPGTKTSDSILARLSDGEFVIKAAAVDKWGLSFLHAINQGILPGFADGGLVSAPRFNAPKLPSPSALPETQSTGASPVNLQQKLVLDPNEVLSSAMSSVAGERTFMTFVSSHKETLRQALGVD